MLQIPIRNIYYLLCYAWNRLDEIERTKVGLDEGDRVIDLLGNVLVDHTARLLRRGLDRGYLSTDEESRTIRGRVDIATTMKRQLLQQGRVKVTHDELSYDVLHNRILKTTLSRLMRMNKDELSKNVKDRCYDLFHRMPEVSEVELTSLTFRNLQLGQNTSSYGLLIDICKFIYDNSLPTEEEGESQFSGFEQNPEKMRLLFQDFVTNFYKRHRPELRPKGREVDWEVKQDDEYSDNLLPKMIVDISLELPDKHILIDTKFTAEALKKHYRSDFSMLRSEHLFQLYAYATNMAANDKKKKPVEAILLYPTVQRHLSDSYSTSGRRIRVETIDLSVEPQLINEQLQALI